MASFTETATLQVKDQSTATIKKINAALKSLQKTAAALKSKTVTITVNDKGLTQATKSAATLVRTLRNINRTSINIGVNVSGLAAAQRQLAAFQRQAQRPVTVATRAGAVPRAPTTFAGGVGGGGGGGRRLGAPGGGIAYPARMAVHVLGGTVGIAAYSVAGLAAALGRGIREGVTQTALGENALQQLQLSSDEQKAATAAIDRITRQERGTLLSRGQIQQTFAEALPVGAYDPAAAEFLARAQMDLVKMEVARGRSLEDAREQSIKYSKALEIAGRLSDPTGKFDVKTATEYFDALKQIAPSLGKEMTGTLVFQFMKYLRQGRYTATPQAMQAGLLTAEEMGASSAGVAYNQALRQLAGQNVPAQTLNELARLGLVTTREVVEGGVTGGKRKRTKRVAGEPLDEESLRANFFTFARDTLIPMMRTQGLDPDKPLDAVKFASRVASTSTARDIIVSAITRMAEVQREVTRATARDPNAAVRMAEQTIPVAIAGLGAQIQGTFGEAVHAFAPVLTPAMKEVGTYFSDLGVDIRKATTGDKDAQKRLEGTAAKAAAAVPIAMLAKGVVGQAIAAVAAPMGITAGLAAAAAPGAPPAMQSLALAGVSLNAAAESLKGAGSGLLNVVGAITGGLAALGIAARFTGAGAVMGGIYAVSEHPEWVAKQKSTVQENLALADARDVEKNETAKLAKAEQEVAANRNRLNQALVAGQRTWIGQHERDLKASQDRLDVLRAETAEKIKTAKVTIDELEARAKAREAAAAGEPFMTALWKWLEEQHKPPPPPAPLPPPPPPPITSVDQLTVSNPKKVDLKKAWEGVPIPTVPLPRARPAVPEPKPTPAQVRKLREDARKDEQKWLRGRPKPVKHLELTPDNVFVDTPPGPIFPTPPRLLYPYGPGLAPEPPKIPEPEPPKIPEPEPPKVAPPAPAPAPAPVAEPAKPAITEPPAPTWLQSFTAAVGSIGTGVAPFSAAVNALAPASQSFAAVFSLGATALVGAGRTAASTIQEGASGAGAALGNAAVAAIRAGVSNLSINVNANVTQSTKPPDTGAQPPN